HSPRCLNAARFGSSPPSSRFRRKLLPQQQRRPRAQLLSKPVASKSTQSRSHAPPTAIIEPNDSDSVWQPRRGTEAEFSSADEGSRHAHARRLERAYRGGGHIQ